MDSGCEPLIYCHEKSVCQDDDCQASSLSILREQEQQQKEEEEGFYSSHYPCSYHIEDIQKVSTDELKPIISRHSISNDTNTDTKLPAPGLLISYSSSLTKSPADIPTTSFSHHDTWGNADEIPTRVPSAALEEEGGFPPLIRCRDNPAMGRYPDDFVVDIDDYDGDDDDGYYSVYDDDSVVSEWSSFLTSIGNEAEVDNESNLSYCGDSVDSDLESKEGESWCVISQASSTTLPQRYTTCKEEKSVLIG